MKRTRALSPRALALPAFALSLAVAAVSWHAPRAEACGGFFCNSFNPVAQAGERILFAVEGTHVTAHIQIAYSGPSEEFSWVLPLPNVPELGVGTDALFAALHARTDPRFQIEWQNEEDCWFQGGCQWDLAADSDGPPAPAPEGGGEVEVLAAGSVGPYEFKVVKGGGDELFTWLNDNGYDQPESAKPIVGHYADIDFVFLALKLEKDAEAGDLQPLVIAYESPTMSCIPLKLTSIAALADMPVWSWVLAKSRAILLNYFHVVLNPRAYDWLNCAQNASNGGWGGWWVGADCTAAYTKLVTDAANAAAGHGFVTEYAGVSSVMDGAIYNPGQYDVEALASAKTPGAFLQAMMSQGIQSTPLVREVIMDHIPKPADEDLPEDCKTDQQFYSMWNIDNCVKHMPPRWEFDPAAFAADIDTRILKPMKLAQDLFLDYPYMTRMFSTVSPEEMNRDPIFSFNPEIPDVSNVHTVKAKATCKPGSSYEAERITLMWDDGTETVYDGDFQNCWNGLPGPAEGEPAAADVQVMKEFGPPESIPADQVAEVDEELDANVVPLPNQSVVEGSRDRNADPIPNTGTFGFPPEDTEAPGDVDEPETPGDGTGPGETIDPGAAPAEKKTSQGCAAGETSPIVPGILLALGLLAAGSRRRREGSLGA